MVYQIKILKRIIKDISSPHARRVFEEKKLHRDMEIVLGNRVNAKYPEYVVVTKMYVYT